MRPQSIVKAKNLFNPTMWRTNYFFQQKTSGCIPSRNPARFSPTIWGSDQQQKKSTLPFFTAIAEHKKIHPNLSVFDLLQNEFHLRALLDNLNAYTEKNYLQEQFIFWLNKYAESSKDFLQNYFVDQQDLSALCRDFTHFCFKNNIFLDAKETLYSFKNHNQLSDAALKQKLIKIQPKEHINLLGFGLDEGDYEKSLAEFLIAQGIAKTIRIYGFDPYASQSPGIEYLTPKQLASINTPIFDIVVARWVLHHVELDHRWSNFIRCINHCQPGAWVLVVEHGFLKDRYAVLDKKLYDLFNATFDIVANIGLRPRYFTSTAPDIGANFFIRYLVPEDFKEITKHVNFHTTQQIFEAGPGLPNQTIYSMRLSK